jgi:hypothetical protein
MIRTDFKKNLSQYTKSVNDAALAAIIKYCGIALRGLDSQYVSMTDDAEVARVAKGFGAKKLGLTEAQTKAVLAKVHAKMKSEKNKMRSTVYYLMAIETGKVAALGKAPAKKAAKKAVKKVKKVKKKAAKKAVKKPAKKAAKRKVAKKARRK